MARLYAAAERRGDLAQAERYSAAVQLLLGAWPSDGDQEPERFPPLQSGISARTLREKTLIGLGTVPPFGE